MSGGSNTHRIRPEPRPHTRIHPEPSPGRSGTHPQPTRNSPPSPHKNPPEPTRNPPPYPGRAKRTHLQPTHTRFSLRQAPEPTGTHPEPTQEPTRFSLGKAPELIPSPPGTHQEPTRNPPHLVCEKRRNPLRHPLGFIIIYNSGEGEHVACTRGAANMNPETHSQYYTTAFALRDSIVKFSSAHLWLLGQADHRARAAVKLRSQA